MTVTFSKIEHEFVYKVMWRATSKTVVIKARTADEAETKLINEMRRTIGGESAMDKKLIEVRDAN